MQCDRSIQDVYEKQIGMLLQHLVRLDGKNFAPEDKNSAPLLPGENGLNFSKLCHN
jgi:hypothetical protein